MDLQTMERAKLYLEKLANGINPIDNTTIPETEVVNNVRISRCFFYVADVLQQVIHNGGIGGAPQKAEFSLPLEKREQFAFSQVPISVSEIVKRINRLTESEKMANLPATVISEWLVSIDVLKIEKDATGKNVKRPTPQGESLGITLESRTGLDGIYFVVLYNEEAQHFILDNLDAALEYRRSKTENQGKPWSVEHDRLLQEMYGRNLPIKEIAATLQRSSGAIRKRLRTLGLMP